MKEEKQILARYAELKIAIRGLEDDVDSLKEVVMEIVESKGADEVQTEFGTFVRASRRTYTYPENIASLEASLKEQKKEAEATGSATYVEKPYVLFKDVTN